MSANEITLEYNDIADLVKRYEDDFVDGQITQSKYVTLTPYEDISTIYAYINSMFTSGKYDSLQREKPFFNIVIAARNIWYRATDLDRKDFEIIPESYDEIIPAFMATQITQDWMNKIDFGRFLNVWGMELATFNETVVKFCEKDGELIPSVVTWDRMICDVVDFDNNPQIERLNFTPAQLRENPMYDQDVVEDLIATARESRENTDGQSKDTKHDFILCYEVHGKLPLYYKTGKESDKKIYRQMMFVTAKYKSGSETKKYTLYAGLEKQSPYMLTWLMPTADGSITFMGAVKNLFESQWMVNHNVKLIKDQIDLASKIVFQTADPQFANQNVFDSIETGQILIHAPNMPITQANTASHDITSMQSYINQWRVLAQEITSTPDVMRGNNMPSGTAFRQAAIIQQESHDNFEIMTENKGLHLEEMFRRFIAPYIQKRLLNNTDEIRSILSDNDIQKIDARYIKAKSTEKVNNITKERLKARKPITPEEQSMLMSDIESSMKKELSEQGNKRFFKPSEISTKTWKEVLGGLSWKMKVNITGENKNKNIVLTTLMNLLQLITSKQGQPMNPQEKFLFNKILSYSGSVSPLEIPEVEAVEETPEQPALKAPNTNIPMPNGGQQVGGMGMMGL